jgi:hypothetical protein
VQALVDEVLYVGVEGADCATQFSVLRDDVGCTPSVKGAHGDDGGVARVYLATDNALEFADDGGPGGDGVNGLVRCGAMAARAGDRDLERVGAGLERAALDNERTNWTIVGEVEAKTGVNMRVLHDACLDHRLRAARTLLSRLEDEFHGAVELVAALLEDLSGSKKHSSVTIVAAGMVDTRVLRGVFSAGFLGKRQGIHISAQKHAAARVSTADEANDPGLGDAGLMFDAEPGEALGDIGGGRVLLETKLGMLVEVATIGDELAREHVHSVVDGSSGDRFRHGCVSSQHGFFFGRKAQLA